MKARTLLACLVLALLAGAFLLGRRGDTPAEVAGVETRPPDQGYVALGAEIVETADDGALLYSLKADRIAQQPASGDVRMQAISMSYHRDAESPWLLTANAGHLRGQGTRIELTGRVRATGRLPQSSLPTEILTEQLEFDTRSQDLSSRQLVTIRVDGQRLTSRGLSANLKQDRVRLESAVHGRYSR